MGVGVEVAFDYDVKPGSELVLAARPDLDSGWRDSVMLALERMAEDVLERDEPVASPGQQGADRGIGQVGQLDPHGGAAGGEGPLDLLQGGRARHAAEAEPRDLVQRRVLFGKGRHAAGDGDHESRCTGPATAGRLTGLGHHLRLGPLDAPGQGGVAEQGQSAGVHAQSLAPGRRAPVNGLAAVACRNTGLRTTLNQLQPAELTDLTEQAGTLGHAA